MIENYEITEDGVIKQIKVIDSKKIYDNNYITNSYNSYGEKVNYMSYLRFGFMMGNITEPINKILDVGYGNGNFLKICSEFIENCYGHDISNYPIPENCSFLEDIFTDEFDVVCFFDSLEHFEDIEFLSKIKTKYVFISLPWCHYKTDDWFKEWKHRRPDEHLYHFNEKSIVKFMERQGYECRIISNVEDIIRKNKSEEKNILSCIFKKK